MTFLEHFHSRQSALKQHKALKHAAEIHTHAYTSTHNYKHSFLRTGNPSTHVPVLPGNQGSVTQRMPELLNATQMRRDRDAQADSLNSAPLKRTPQNKSLHPEHPSKRDISRWKNASSFCLQVLFLHTLTFSCAWETVVAHAPLNVSACVCVTVTGGHSTAEESPAPRTTNPFQPSRGPIEDVWNLGGGGAVLPSHLGHLAVPVLTVRAL